MVSCFHHDYKLFFKLCLYLSSTYIFTHTPNCIHVSTVSWRHRGSRTQEKTEHWTMHVVNTVAGYAWAAGGSWVRAYLLAWVDLGSPLTFDHQTAVSPGPSSTDFSFPEAPWSSCIGQNWHSRAAMKVKEHHLGRRPSPVLAKEVTKTSYFHIQCALPNTDLTPSCCSVGSGAVSPSHLLELLSHCSPGSSPTTLNTPPPWSLLRPLLPLHPILPRTVAKPKVLALTLNGLPEISQ